MRSRLLFLSFAFVLALTAPAQEKNPKTLKTSGYAPVNGLKLYYEVHGEGKPLVLIHGSYMTIGLNWTELIPELAKNRKIIALELQGHGHTADIDRPISYAALASDVAGLLRHLKIDSADVLGYSLGGTVAYQLAIEHPKLIRKMILISTTFRMKGWLPELVAAFPTFQPEIFEQTPLKKFYEEVAPDPKHWKAFVSKYMEFDTHDFDLGADKVKAIKSPILFIMGDNDGVLPGHKTEMYELAGGGNVFADMQGLPRSQFAMYAGNTHVTLMKETKRIAEDVSYFLDNEPKPGPPEW